MLIFSFHLECFLLVDGVVEVGVDPLAVLLHVLLKQFPLEVGCEVSDLPDGSPGAHVLRPLGEGVRLPRGQHHLRLHLLLTLLTQTRFI